MKKSKVKNQKSKITVVLVTAMVSCLPLVTVADSVSVTNNITTSSNSGGNTSTGGQVVEGKTENSVSVYTEINGEVVEDYSETSEGSIHYSNTTTSEGSTSSVSVTASSDAQSHAVSDAIRDIATEVETRLEAEYNAAHNSASEGTESLDEEHSSGGVSETGTTTTSASSSLAAAGEVEAGLPGQGVATRIVVAVRTFISTIIGFFW